MPATILELLNERFEAPLRALLDAAGASDSLAALRAEGLVRVAADARFGDYQCNVAMPLARTLRGKPRDIAEQLVAGVQLADVAEPLEIAGPGFINIRIRPEFLVRRIEGVLAGGDPARAGIERVAAPQRIVVDYSSPNIAKQMHVGHLRSTIIGDVFVRVFEFLGHTVIRQNHIGDWGTSLGMVLLGLWYIHSRLMRGETMEIIEQRLAQLSAPESPAAQDRLLKAICAEWAEDLQKAELDRYYEASLSLEQLELGYRFIQGLTGAARGRGCTILNRDGAADDIADLPRKITQMMQAGGAGNEPEVRAWQRAREISLRYSDGIYRQLEVLLTQADARGESSYNEYLAGVVAELREKLAGGAVCGALPSNASSRLPARAEFRIDDGAACIFLYNADGTPRFKNAEGEILPVIIQKSDGAFLYATTDLAALRYRVRELAAKRIIYVTDARQKLHFEMFFTIAACAGWITGVQVDHVTFGSVLGEDKKPLKTREGQNVKLRDLLEEAERRALEVYREKQVLHAAEDDASLSTGESSDAPVPQVNEQGIAHAIGIGAVKYADLARDRNTDYVFSWDKMLAMQGNTAPYMMYAYARIRSIHRKAAERFGFSDTGGEDRRVLISDPAERALAMRLARLPEEINRVAADLLPHTLCNYLYDLAADFMRFYEACPVVQAENETLRASRMHLCDLTARSLKLGLNLLGIETLERM